MFIVQWFICICWDLEKVDCWEHNSHRWGKNILSRKILHTSVFGYIPWQQNKSLSRQKWVPDGCGNWQETNTEADLEKTDWGHQRWKRGQGGPDKVDNTWYIIFGAFQGRTVRWTICAWPAESGWLLLLLCLFCFCTEGKTPAVTIPFPCTYPTLQGYSPARMLG